MISANGFRRVAETIASIYEHTSEGDIEKTVVRQSRGIDSFHTVQDTAVPEITIGNCHFSDQSSSGRIDSKGQVVEWNLEFSPPSREPKTFDLSAGPSLRLPGLNQRLNRFNESTLESDLTAQGVITITRPGKPKQQRVLESASGRLTHSHSSRLGWTWIAGHCNQFVDSKGNPVDCLFDGRTVRNKIAGPLLTPSLSTFYFRYRGERFEFNSLFDSVRLRSDYQLTEWNIKADRGELAFRGQLKAELRDIAGITLEDTDGSLLYCNQAGIASMTLHVYRRGQLEASLFSKNSAGYEIVEREKSSYIPLLT